MNFVNESLQTIEQVGDCNDIVQLNELPTFPGPWFLVKIVANRNLRFLIA
jgi:hypothetical protein